MAAIKDNRSETIFKYLSFRSAETKDIDFIIEAIIEAEKSGSNQIGTCHIFNLSEEEYKEILRDILVQDIKHFDYYLSGYLIAELNGEYVGTSGSWLEGAEGMPSGIIRSAILLPYLDKSRISEINKSAKIISDFSISREPGTLQIEYVYIRGKFRGKGIFKSLVKNNISRNLNIYSFSKAQSILFKENASSYNPLLKMGYNIVEEKCVNDPGILKFFPYNTKVLLEIDKNNLEKLLA